MPGSMPAAGRRRPEARDVSRRVTAGLVCARPSASARGKTWRTRSWQTKPTVTFAASPTRRCSATPSGAASIRPRGAGAIARRWSRPATACDGPGRSLPNGSMRSPPALSRSASNAAQRIGIWSLNRPEWTLTQFAAAKAGLILVTINPAYRLSELEFALHKVGCSGDRHRDGVQDQQLHGDAQHAAAGARERQARAIARRAAAGVAHRDPDRRPRCTGHDPVRRGRAAWAEPSIASSSPRSVPPCSSTIPSTSSSPAARRDRPRA